MIDPKTAKNTTATTNQSDDASRVRALMEDWARAVRDADMEGVLAHHAEDIVMFDVPPPLQAKGIDAYRKTWELFFTFQGPGGSFDLDELEIAAGDRIAFCHSIVTCGSKDPQGQFEVRLTIGLRKVNGDWIVTHEHHSVPAQQGSSIATARI